MYVHAPRRRCTACRRLLAVEVKAEVGAADVPVALQFAEAGAHLVLFEGLAGASHPPAVNLAGSLKSLFAKVAENASVSLTPTTSKDRLTATLPWAFGSALRGRPSAKNAKLIAALSALLPGALHDTTSYDLYTVRCT